MACFARKIGYMASRTSFISLIEVVKKKGGKPTFFVIYWFNRRHDRGGFEQIILPPDRGEAKQAFHYNYFNLVHRLEKTNDWLYNVSVGGTYTLHREGDWVRIGGLPRKWKRQRKPLMFGELGHILNAKKIALKALKESLPPLEDRRNEKEIAITEEIKSLELEIANLLGEMRYRRAKHFVSMPATR